MKSLDSQIREKFSRLSEEQKIAFLIRFELMVAAQAPALPRLPPGPVLSHRETTAAAPKGRKCSASSDRAEPSNAETAEFLRLLKLHPEKCGAVRQILSCGRGNALERMEREAEV